MIQWICWVLPPGWGLGVIDRHMLLGMSHVVEQGPDTEIVCPKSSVWINWEHIWEKGPIGN